MLIKCTECELPVSDKAIICPHCGIPIKKEKSRKFVTGGASAVKRLPNGFGQITRIKNKPLRNPYRVMVTVGKTDTGKPICKLLKPRAYFPTYNEAYMALVEYNKNPYELDSELTVAELYEMWSKEYFKTLKSESSYRTITSAWKYCEPLVGAMRARDLRARHIKEVLSEGRVINGDKEKVATANTKSRIKSLFNLMLDYALEYELVDKNYARTFEISQNIIKEREDTKRGHITFTDEEMKILWSNLDLIPYLDLIIVQCYTGFRPQELGLIKLENVHLSDSYIIGGIKTDAGTDRLVPIHSKIKNIIIKYYEEAMSIGSEYLINCTDSVTHIGSNKMTYDKYKYRFNNIIKRLGLNKDHRPHDPRKQFITMAKKYNVDEYAIKRIVGHAISDITEKVYTERDIAWLKTEVEKIL